jgi:hypothetical protein
MRQRIHDYYQHQQKDTPAMTAPIPFTLTNESITVILNGTPRTIHKGSAQYPGLRSALFAEQWDRIEALVTVRGSLATWFKDTGFDIDMQGVMRYSDGLHELDVPTSLSERIKSMVANGEDPSPLIKFYQRLANNPSYRSRTQLFAFMAHVGIPIEPDGTFLAYKGINDNLTDVHSGKVNNAPGTHHSMPRNMISDDPDHACHYGFHVGALSYARDFGSVVVICRVDPQHVVCVPHDSSQQKMRVCDYESIGFWNGETMPSTTYSPNLERDASLDEEVEDDAVEDADADWESDNILTSKGVGDGGDGLKVQPAIKNVKSKAAQLGRISPAKLMERGIDELRKYASGHLKIVGASKMSGGKSALVAAILRARKKRSRK